MISSAIPTRLRASPAATGIGFMLLATLLFAVMDSINKSLTATYPVQQVVWSRFAFQFGLMLFLIPRVGFSGLLRTKRPALHVARGLLIVFATYAFITSISLVPLADAYTITFTAPLLVTLLSIPLLKERVGWRRLCAVLVGFCGVIIVLQPGHGSVHWALLLPLVTAACFALYQVLTRIGSYSPHETALMMLFYTALVGMVVNSAIVPFHWQHVAPTDWLWMITAGAFAVGGHLSLIQALKIAPASLISPFIYTQIIWAFILGYLWFGDVPGGGILAGCMVIVGSGVYVFYREAVRRKT
ncbi:MAG: DMT family transporter [Pseudomonadota bacterium]